MTKFGQVVFVELQVINQSKFKFMENILKIVATSVTSIIGLFFSKTTSFLDRSDRLMTKEALELLSNPKTRDEFIQFSQGKIKESNDANGEQGRTKTFSLKNGEEITIINFS